MIISALHRPVELAVAFFTMSRSTLVLASSRRKRACSASTSITGRCTGTLVPAAAFSVPARLGLIPFHRLDSGMLSRFAA